LRVGNVFAWVPRGSLEFVDVVTGKRRQTITPAFPADYHDNNYAFGFDEQTIVTAYETFDIATGQIIGKPDVSRFHRPQGSPLAVRNGIYYYLRKSKIYATDVNFEKGGEVFVADAPVEPIERSSKGFVLWTGRKWVQVPWSTTLPNEAKASGDGR
jgi:hypothetical protein